MPGCKGKILTFVVKQKKKTFAGKSPRLLFHFSFSQQQTAAPQFAAENENLNF